MTISNCPNPTFDPSLFFSGPTPNNPTKNFSHALTERPSSDFFTDKAFDEESAKLSYCFATQDGKRTLQCDRLYVAFQNSAKKTKESASLVFLTIRRQKQALTDPHMYGLSVDAHVEVSETLYVLYASVPRLYVLAPPMKDHICTLFGKTTFNHPVSNTITDLISEYYSLSLSQIHQTFSEQYELTRGENICSNFEQVQTQAKDPKWEWYDSEAEHKVERIDQETSENHKDFSL